MMRGSAIAHGGRLNAARLRWPEAPEPWIDLSTGINPVAYPLPAFRQEDFARLPEPEAEIALCDIAARAYGVGDPAMVVAAPGTQILISLLPLLCPSPHVAVLGPTYAEHAACWAACGAKVETVTDFATLARAQTAVVVNPNNPDGRRCAPGDLVDLAAVLARKGGVLVVDEAFVDLEGPGLSLAGLLPRPGLVVLRSFGKSYGLAGVRLGFLLASPALAGRVRGALGPWAVSGPALSVGSRALADVGWREAAAVRLERDGARLVALLTEAGLTWVGGTRLFHLFETVEAAGWVDRLGRAGVAVRPFADFPRLLRFGVPAGAEAWSRLALLRSFG